MKRHGDERPALVKRPPAVIVDVDGTLVDVRSIRRHVTGQARNFHRFHVESVDCPPNRWVVDLVREYNRKGYAVLVVTGRSRVYERHTSMWLALHDVPSTEMHMRLRGDTRPDVEVKRNIVAAIRRRWFIVRAIDDNPNIISLWEHGQWDGLSGIRRRRGVIGDHHDREPRKKSGMSGR